MLCCTLSRGECNKHIVHCPLESSSTNWWWVNHCARGLWGLELDHIKSRSKLYQSVKSLSISGVKISTVADTPCPIQIARIAERKLIAIERRSKEPSITDSCGWFTYNAGRKACIEHDRYVSAREESIAKTWLIAILTVGSPIAKVRPVKRAIITGNGSNFGWIWERR